MILDAYPTVKRLIYLILLVPASWVVGLFIFINNIPEQNLSITQPVDAVVILTGGSMRLEEGLEAFAHLKAKKLLISGVGQGATINSILSGTKNQELLGKINQDDIILGNLANNTITNALEAKIFMMLHGFKSMLLVTSNYHIMRSVLIFKRQMPEYAIYPFPVCSDNFRKSGNFISLPSLKLSATEYNKLLGFYLMLLDEKFTSIYDSIILQVYKAIRPILSVRDHFQAE
jgi:uncharacterized SAM-binding protein YcdF (DUF218 family)